MKIPVPFYKAERDGDCGPLALKMILRYFGKDYSLKELSRLSETTDEGYSWTIGLAKASAELGFSTEFYTSTFEFDPKIFDTEFYKKHANKNSSKSVLEELMRKCIELNVKLEEKKMSLKELLSKVTEDILPIALIDWNTIKDREGFQGHILPIVGYDEENVYVHQPGPENPMEFYAIKKDLFDKARQLKETDEDIVLIYRK